MSSAKKKCTLEKKLDICITTRRKRKINKINNIISNIYKKNKNVLRKCTSEYNKEENKIISQNEKVFPTISIMLRGISPLFKNNIMVIFPSEYEDIKYNVNIIFEDCKINMNCNCQERFMGIYSKPRTNCKHIAYIMNSILFNYYKAISPNECSKIAVIDIIIHLIKKYNLKLDIKNIKFRTCFVKAIKKLSEYHKYSFEDEKKISLDIKPNSSKYKKISVTFDNGDSKITSFSPITGNLTFKSKDIELMIINMIRDFIFSFGYCKHKTKKIKSVKNVEQEEQYILKMFEKLVIVD